MYVWNVTLILLGNGVVDMTEPQQVLHRLLGYPASCADKGISMLVPVVDKSDVGEVPKRMDQNHKE